MRHARLDTPSVWLVIAAIALLLSCGGAQAFVYKVLHNFKTAPDGASPSGGLIVDDDGNFYGVTAGGGRACGCGTVYKLSPKGRETVLYRFTGRQDGSAPAGRLARDAAGNLYGVTGRGGPTLCGGYCGTVFELSPNGQYKRLHTFLGGNNDGRSPNGDLAIDAAGNLYGTTGYGGGTGCTNQWGCGVVYRLAPDGTMTLLYAFQGGTDGAEPIAGLIRDDAGNLYGTTFHGGDRAACYPFPGCGVVFELPAGGTEKVLYAFHSYYGDFPADTLARDSAGHLYGGTTWSHGRSTLYRLSAAGKLKTLIEFTHGDPNGEFPHGAVLPDGHGNLFVNNLYGGSGSDTNCGVDGCGTLLELARDGTASVRHAFGAWPQDGFSPAGSLVLVNNKLYGVTNRGGEYGAGTVWVLAL